MIVIGCDYHPSWQQICFLDTVTGESMEKKLEHASGEAEKYYRGLPGPALIGMESTGNCQWFVEMATTAGQCMGGRRGEDPSQRSSPAEDGSARCRTDSEIADGRKVSADLDAVRAGEGSAAAFDSSLQAGADSDASEK